MRFLTLYLPEAHVKALDELVKRKMYPSRSEAIRHAVRDLLIQEYYGYGVKVKTNV